MCYCYKCAHEVYSRLIEVDRSPRITSLFDMFALRRRRAFLYCLPLSNGFVPTGAWPLLIQYLMNLVLRYSPVLNTIDAARIFVTHLTNQSNENTAAHADDAPCCNSF